MSIKSRLNKLASVIGICSDRCQCSDEVKQRNYEELDGKDILDAIFSGRCAACNKPNNPIGYTVADSVKDQAARNTIAESVAKDIETFYAGESFETLLDRKFTVPCRTCGGPIKNWTDGCPNCEKNA